MSIESPNWQARAPEPRWRGLRAAGFSCAEQVAEYFTGVTVKWEQGTACAELRECSQAILPDSRIRDVGAEHKLRNSDRSSNRSLPEYCATAESVKAISDRAR